jgi:hypothetical protein
MEDVSVTALAVGRKNKSTLLLWFLVDRVFWATLQGGDLLASRASIRSKVSARKQCAAVPRRLYRTAGGVTQAHELASDLQRVELSCEYSRAIS